MIFKALLFFRFFLCYVAWNWKIIQRFSVFSLAQPVAENKSSECQTIAVPIADAVKPDNEERTFIMVKPDGVQRGIVGSIVRRFEEKGYRLVAMRTLHATAERLQQHYSDLTSKPFYPGLLQYMLSGPVVAMVWQGLNVVKVTCNHNYTAERDAI